MMTSKIEDRLRKNGVKIKKYYKWLRWSMILLITYIIYFNFKYDELILVKKLVSLSSSILNTVKSTGNPHSFSKMEQIKFKSCIILSDLSE